MFPKIEKILYATDLSPNAAYALRYAMDSAVKHDAELVVLHAFEQISPTAQAMLVYLDESRRQEIFHENTGRTIDRIKERLNTFCEREFKDHPEYLDKVISIEVCEGFPAEEILSKAKELNCDLIIMGTHGKGIIANTFLGSTAKRVLRRTRIPVFIIPIPKGELDITVHDI